MRCLACNKILSDYEATRGIIMNDKKVYLDMCVTCDATPPENISDNLELLEDEFDLFDEVSFDGLFDEEFPDFYEEVKL